MMGRRRLTALVAGGAIASMVLAGCGGSAESTSTPAATTQATAGGAPSGDPVVIGTSAPLTGAFAVFGPILQAGYEAGVAAINDAGGVTVDGEQRPLQLIVKDNKSDPQEVTSVTKSLVVDDGAVALLGSITPPLVIPFSNVAEQEGIPALSTVTPTGAWLAANQSGWHWAFDIFVDEVQQTALNFQASDLAPTNKKVALFTDTEEDGVVMGGLWASEAAKYGYEIAYHAKFPVGTTDFSQYVREAKDSGAEIVIAQMIPPDAMALWKQMKAMEYQPQIAYAEKASVVGWAQALGELAEGTSVFGWWTPTNASPEALAVADEFAAQFGETTAQQGAIAAYAMVQLLADAITKAGSTDPEAIRGQLAATTDFPSVLGSLTIGPNNAGIIPAVMTQWQGQNQVVTYPQADASGTLIAPVAGLAK